MSPLTESVYFENEAGQLLLHPAGYALLRYRPAKRRPGDLTALLTKLGQLLLSRGWHKFLADNRQMSPFTETEKAWFVASWLGHQVPRPAPLLGVVVVPQDVVARLSFLQMYASATDTSIRYLTFTDLAEAEQHLLSV